jgi:hypothetical protein
MPRVRTPLRALSLVVLPLALLSVGCIFVFRGVTATAVDTHADSVLIRSPAKAHLRDGSVVLYRNGVLVLRDTLRGAGTRYALDGSPQELPEGSRIPVDSVAAMESFHTRVNATRSIVVSVAATAAVVGILAAAIAASNCCSCPVVYSDSAGTMVLDAEPFPNSVAPLFEQRDVQRLQAQADSTGIVRLEIRNDAVETHDFNHLELLEVSHAADELVMPDWGDPGRRLVAVRGVGPVATAVDGAGRDVHAVLSAVDSLVYRTATSVIDRARIEDFGDHIDISAPTPAGTDSAALVFTMKNSLLTTMLLYDMMLAERGWRSLDWLSNDMAQIGRAVELGKWYTTRMGMNVAVWRNERWEPVVHMPNAGPIAWRRIAAVVPVPPGDTLRVRLSFVADQWRIGSVALAARVRAVKPRHVPLTAVIGPEGDESAEALRDLRSPDARYYETHPGEHFTAVFDVGAATRTTRTFALASQGFYTEWLRTEWIRRASTTQPFQPSDSTLVAALRRWSLSKDSLERHIGAAPGRAGTRP